MSDYFDSLKQSYVRQLAMLKGEQHKAEQAIIEICDDVGIKDCEVPNW